MKQAKDVLPCRCALAYTSRGLESPDCPWHQFGEDVDQLLREVRADCAKELEVLAERTSIYSQTVSRMIREMAETIIP